LAAGLAGLVFGVGLLVSGMTRPEKVLGFLDVFGRWDASLMFVMLGAIGVHALGYRWALRRSRPLYASAFALPRKRAIDARLLGGAALFGLGWGLGGYCPGPSVVALPGGGSGVALFVLAMLAGLFVTDRVDSALARSARDETRPDAAISG
jgi:uncharacterized membrane protein YedE/YeeE